MNMNFYYILVLCLVMTLCQVASIVQAVDCNDLEASNPSCPKDALGNICGGSDKGCCSGKCGTRGCTLVCTCNPGYGSTDCGATLGSCPSNTASTLCSGKGSCRSGACECLDKTEYYTISSTRTVSYGRACEFTDTIYMEDQKCGVVNGKECNGFKNACKTENTLTKTCACPSPYDSPACYKCSFLTNLAAPVVTFIQPITNALVVHWTAVASADSYSILYNPGNIVVTVSDADVVVTSSSSDVRRQRTISNLINGVRYAVSVTSVNTKCSMASPSSSVVSQTPSAASTDTITNFIIINNQRFATITNVSPASLVDGNDAAVFVSVPQGWSIAPVSDSALVAAQSGSWGTICLVFADGSGENRYEHSQSCGTNALVTEPGTGRVKTDLSAGSSRIFITQPAKPGDVDTSLTPTTFTNSRVFNGIEYATLDNWPVTDATEACQGVMMFLPSGWSLAPYTKDAVVALTGPSNRYGTTCLVFSDGASYFTYDLSLSCGTGQLRTLPASKNWYRPVDCNRRIVIRRVTQASNSFPIVMSAITNYISVGMYSYATLDNAVTTTYDATAGCQLNPLQIPGGWGLAPDTTTTKNILINNGFTSGCIILGNGLSYTISANVHLCYPSSSPQLLNVTSSTSSIPFYAPRWCNQRILLRRLSTDAGQCSSWGDPHLTNFDGRTYDFMALGDFDMFKSPTARVQVRQFKTGLAASNMGVAMRVGDLSTPASTTNPKLAVVASSALTAPVFYINDVPTLLTTDRAVSIANSGSIVVSGTLRRLNDDGATETDDLTFTFTFPDITVKVIFRTSAFDVQYCFVYIKINYSSFRSSSGGVLVPTTGLCGRWDGADDVNDFPGLIATHPNAIKTSEYTKWGVNAWSVTSLDTYFPGSAPSGALISVDSLSLLDPVDRQRGEDACLGLLLTPDQYNACVLDVAITGDESLAKGIGANTVGGSTPVCPATAAQPTSIRTVYQMQYALLDGTDPASTNVGCMGAANAFLRVPDGWTIAPDVSRHRVALTLAPWGTACIVMANGAAYTSALSTCSSNGMLTVHPTDAACVAVASCPARILLVREQPGPQNLVVNPALTVDTRNQMRGWALNAPNSNPLQQRSSVDSGATDGFCVIVAVGAEQNVVHGVSQTVYFNPASDGSIVTSSSPNGIGVTAVPLSVGLWSKAVGVTGAPNDGYALQLTQTLADGTKSIAYVYFNTGTHDYEYRTADIYPKKLTSKMVSLTVSILITRNPGTYCFKSVVTGSASYELLSNPSFATAAGTGASALKWSSYGAGYVTVVESRPVTTDGAALDTYSVQVTSVGTLSTKFNGGVAQTVDPALLSPSSWSPSTMNACGLLVGGWARTVNVTGDRGAGLSLYVDVGYKTGSSQFGLVTPISTSTHQWAFEEGVFGLDGSRVVTSVSVYGLLRGLSGAVFFDDLSVRFLPCSTGWDLPFASRGISQGDPHISTLDGLEFDHNLVGEFQLVSDGILTLQARHEKAGAAAVNGAFAINYVRPSDGSTGIFSLARDPPSLGLGDVNLPVVTIGGVVDTMFNLGASYLVIGNNVGIVTKSGHLSRVFTPLTYSIYFFETKHKVNIGVSFSAEWKVQYLRVDVHVPPSSAGKCSGLFGNYNGDTTDDVNTALLQATPATPQNNRRLQADEVAVGPYGYPSLDPGFDSHYGKRVEVENRRLSPATLSVTPSFHNGHRQLTTLTPSLQLLQTLADAFRVSAASSRLPYKAGETTTTYTDTTFVPPLSVQDLNPGDVAKATKVCEGTVGLGGNTLATAQCVFDVVGTADPGIARAIWSTADVAQIGKIGQVGSTGAAVSPAVQPIVYNPAGNSEIGAGTTTSGSNSSSSMFVIIGVVVGVVAVGLVVLAFVAGRRHHRSRVVSTFPQLETVMDAVDSNDDQKKDMVAAALTVAPLDNPSDVENPSLPPSQGMVRQDRRRSSATSMASFTQGRSQSVSGGIDDDVSDTGKNRPIRRRSSQDSTFGLLDAEITLFALHARRQTIIPPTKVTIESAQVLATTTTTRNVDILRDDISIIEDQNTHPAPLPCRVRSRSRRGERQGASGDQSALRRSSLHNESTCLSDGDTDRRPSVSSVDSIGGPVDTPLKLRRRSSFNGDGSQSPVQPRRSSVTNDAATTEIPARRSSVTNQERRSPGKIPEVRRRSSNSASASRP